MEEIFKQNLLRLRQPPKPRTFGEALFPLTHWRPKKADPAVVSTEKKQVLESFERFAQENAKPVIKVEGGEITLKAEPVWENLPSMNELSLGKSFVDIQFQNKNKVQVIFVTENFRSWAEVENELKTGFINELITGFPLKTAELFERMILAMKLTPEEVIIYPVENEGHDLSQEVMGLASHFKPEVIITLGAKATQKILKSTDRLSMVHGQFFERRIQSGDSFQVVPLFHPSIIETNQNMKKTAWTDMQKIMKFLKKL